MDTEVQGYVEHSAEYLEKEHAHADTQGQR